MRIAAGRHATNRRKRPKPPPPAEDLSRFCEVPAFSQILRTGADHFIGKNPIYQEVIDAELDWDSKPEGELTEVAERLRLATRTEHNEAIAFAYAFWIKASRNPRYQEFISNAAKQRRRLSKSTTALHLIIARFVSYGDNDTTPTGKKRGLYNRDVQAIRWLHENDVPPDQMVDLAMKHGEGLVPWEKRMRKQRAKIKVVREDLEKLHNEHANKLKQRLSITPRTSISEIVLSYRFGVEHIQHRYRIADNSPEVRRLVEEFERNLGLERTTLSLPPGGKTVT